MPCSVPGCLPWAVPVSVLCLVPALVPRCLPAQYSAQCPLRCPAVCPAVYPAQCPPVFPAVCPARCPLRCPAGRSLPPPPPVRAAPRPARSRPALRGSAARAAPGGCAVPPAGPRAAAARHWLETGAARRGRSMPIDRGAGGTARHGPGTPVFPLRSAPQPPETGTGQGVKAGARPRGVLPAPGPACGGAADSGTPGVLPGDAARSPCPCEPVGRGQATSAPYPNSRATPSPAPLFPPAEGSSWDISLVVCPRKFWSGCVLPAGPAPRPAPSSCPHQWVQSSMAGQQRSDTGRGGCARAPCIPSSS